MSDWSDPIDLSVGDLCVYEGDPVLCCLQQRIIYRVIKKEPTRSAYDPDAWTSDWVFSFVVAHDPFPTSAVSEQYARERTHSRASKSLTKHGTRGLRKLGLLDLVMLRNELDNFTRQRAIDLGEENAGR